MANKTKISIKPMTNAAAIASTLGIGMNLESKEEKPIQKTSQASEKPAAESLTKSGQTENLLQTADGKNIVKSERQTPATTSQFTQEANQTVFTPPVTSSQAVEMPLLIAIKRKFPGKELYILSLLYLQRNGRGLVQMTVGNMMALYSSVFQDVIKDDTARRSLKRLSDAGFIKTTSIPGNNSGYVYEIGDLLESELLSAEEKREFAELTEFVNSKLNGAFR